MNRVALLLLSVGTALFIALLAWQGFGAVTTVLATAGWGLLLVALVHAVPIVFDAAAIAVLFGRHDPAERGGAVGRGRGLGAWRNALIARWVGEAVNSLLPAGQIGGPVVMGRQLAQRGMRLSDAVAAIMVSTTLQAVAQILFAVFGILLFCAHAASGGSAPRNLGIGAAIATAVLSAIVATFYAAQRRGLFARGLRLMSKLFGKRDLSGLSSHADSIDAAVKALYRERGKAAASFVASLVGWFAGTLEVWLALRLLGHPVDWVDALLLESVGQIIRGAAFAIPGSLGVQEGGYLLLAPLVGLAPEAALALSLAKRAREVLLGVPGLLYLHFSERKWQRRRAVSVSTVEAVD